MPGAVRLNARHMRILIAFAVIVASASPALAQAFANAKSSVANYSVADSVPAKACESLSTFKGKDIVAIQARVVPATADTPQHCRVVGTISPEVAFEINLPDRWNRRFYMTGNGGLAGDALDGPTNADRTGALTNGFVIARTNTGHDARKEPSGSFILSNPQKAIDYAYRAVHVTAETAKAVATDYYSQPIKFSYWNSCSNGGRQGLIEAQRFPDDFDGIVANAPWVDQTGFTIGAMWNQRALTATPVSAAKMATVADRVMAKCDAIDGLKDGLIDDPRKCTFDPAKDVPACTAGTDDASCLTPAQASAIAKVYGGPVSNGKPFFPGFMPGSEAVMPTFGGGTGTGWSNVILPPAQPGGKPADFNLAENTMKYLVHTPPKPDYDYQTFDFDRDVKMVDAWSAKADAKNPDLAKFKDRGGKLLMTYGWSDTILQPMMGVNYYEAALAKNGRSTPDFFRLFMVPGMAHCGGGIGPDRHDAMTAIINWVEKGQAPSTMVASKVVDDKVVRTRPLCAYPQVARHTGTGSIDDAANFRCVAP